MTAAARGPIRPTTSTRVAKARTSKVAALGLALRRTDWAITQVQAPRTARTPLSVATTSKRPNQAISPPKVPSAAAGRAKGSTQQTAQASEAASATPAAGPATLLSTGLGFAVDGPQPQSDGPRPVAWKCANSSS